MKLRQEKGTAAQAEWAVGQQESPLALTSCHSCHSLKEAAVIAELQALEGLVTRNRILNSGNRANLDEFSVKPGRFMFRFHHS